jgi:DNA-binding NarL/FixJ family response regulator
MDPIRVLLVDDNPTFLRIAARFLREHCDGELEVVGALCGGQAAVEEAPKLRPQVILLDLAMSDLHGLEAIPLLRAELPEVGIIALTLLDTEGYRQAAQAAGADGFVAKATMSTDLLPTIRRVMGTNPPKPERETRAESGKVEHEL